MTSRFFRLALVLGLISAVGPFAIDMYLPALPSIGASLHASPAAVQMSLMAFFITIGACQLVYGPLSDRVGRKAPILWGMALFTLGSIGCALAPNVELLIAFRVLQALGACAGMVIPRAIVRDNYTGVDAARMMSLLMLVFSISPILAPITGSLIIEQVGWRGVFWFVAAAGIVGLVLTATQLKETRHADARVDSSWRDALNSYGRLLKDLRFLGTALIGAFGIASFFVYLSSSSFVVIGHFGQSPRGFSLLFALNAVSFFGAAQLNGPLAARFGLAPVVRVAVAGFAGMMLLLLGLTMFGVNSLALMVGMMLIAYGFLGLVIPTTVVLALEDHGANAGTASALLGAVQMFTGATVMAIAGLFSNGHPLPMIAGIAACATASFVMAQLALPRRKALPAVGE